METKKLQSHALLAVVAIGATLLGCPSLVTLAGVTFMIIAIEFAFYGKES